jgi:pyrophosphatase PpaX
MKYKAVLFDVDGTLLDTTEYIYQAFEHALKKHHQPQSRERLQKVMGKPLDLCYQMLTELEDVELLMEAHRQFQLDHSELSKPFPSTVSTLKTLHSSGFQIAAITTRARESAKKTLEAADIFQYFHYFVGFEDVENPKPHPEPLLKTLSFFGINPSEAIMVGDSDVDVMAGKSAETKTVGVTYGFSKDHIHLAKPDFLIHDIKDILPIVK